MRKTERKRNSSDSGDGLRVLIVDDDPIFRSVVSAKLARIEAAIVEAGDGAEAWEHLTRSPFNLALVDLEMPNMKGIDLIQCMRGYPATRHIPVVVMTSRNDSEAVRGSLDAGATSFMTKPVNWSMFTNHIEFLLRLHASSEFSRRAVEIAEQSAAYHAGAFDKLQASVESSVQVLARVLEQMASEQSRSGGAVTSHSLQLMVQEIGRLQSSLTAAQRDARQDLKAQAPGESEVVALPAAKSA